MNSADTTDDQGDLPEDTQAGAPADSEQLAADQLDSETNETSVDDSATTQPSSEESEAPAPPPPKKQVAPKVDKVDDGEAKMDWYILKVAFNREDSIAEALRKRVKMEGMTEEFGEIVVPTEDVATFTRDGKRRVTKRKLLPGYIMVNMIINDDTWFLVRETGGISDFTGAAGKPMPMEPSDIERFINKPEVDDEDETPIKTAIPFKVGDRVRVKEGNFENQEGDVDSVDEANGRITVIINIFGRSVPMELDHWQVEAL
ncbi:transcription termination/antitermination factor NusG [Rhodopirellula maiorica SM1]|uniref:Transcription termination/antitermination protein NusG n=1 Tax=Rhodopirellula maiorica SM1 TaxID=1265738 RepID=M5RMG5_9BACT|nr:transcription termination/antitermination protein NusG [Rhodopirellula maiorica]EMI16582.1 transcription termination/antitermination factor NusG [Rhodopirellula maiorica SM1]